ncbi:Chromodomain-helicase-DNA-binding protein 2 [Halotydeus destructor]|nr:Chromodomain-helicase-DNA-binding protein 2 [Halotydeus destructor]
MKMSEETSWTSSARNDNVNTDNENNKDKGSSDDDSSSNDSGSDSESGSSSSSNSSSDSNASKKSGSSSRSSNSEKRSAHDEVTNDADDSPTKADLSDTNDEDASMDVDTPRKKRSQRAKELKEMIETDPDMYGVRRSGRSRKEPERYSTKDEENSDSDSEALKKKSKSRKNSENWDGSDSTTDQSEKPRRQVKKPIKRNESKRRKRLKSVESFESDSDSDEEKRGPRRQTSKKVSYKEQSDHTDSEDLVDVDYGDYNPETDTGETIEKILEQRLGLKGAIGQPTTPFNVESHGDPNDALTRDSETEQQYLVKWKGKSYMHTTWETDDSLVALNAKGLKKVENYLRRVDEIRIWKQYATPEDIEYFDCQEEMANELRQLYLNCERIIAHQPSKSTETCQPEYLCKWEGLPYSECTFEDGGLIGKKYSKEIEDYHAREKSQKTPSKLCRALKSRPKFVPMKTQPDYIGGNDTYVLRDYQLDGVNWLAHTWCKRNSVILADEMGLGKTIQTISFFSYLFNHHEVYGPFLMVVPLSTMAAWQKEFGQWAPELNLVVYIGDVNSRNMIRSYEWCHPGNKRLKFNVLLTTYEILLKDKGFLGSVGWAALGIDEAHRLKNDDSLLYKTLIEFDTNHRMLITGTPLQNSLRELWALLHFIMPDKFSSWEEFEAEHGDSDAKGYAKLHKQLEPFLLRRVKKDVEKSLPAKVEQILRVEMTQVQKQYYKWILTKNYQALAKGLKGSLNGFANIMMELKKCCNHASLIRTVDDYNHLDPLTRLIRGSGKLLLLDKLLCRLKETGHRVLIFSQMVRMLDILGDYLSLRRFAFQRLDGSIKGEIRKQALDHFNAEGSNDFCFLLSTRAGGLGINLATADTVIIFDSDWNPQNDLQAQARAHRIGQKNQVNIYRLVTKNSVEEDILERAKQKMVLDHLVIQRMDTTGKTVLSNKPSSSSNSSNSTPFNKEELAQILKFGAEELFKEGEDADEEPNVDIDDILRRAETREDAPVHTGNELLSAFKMASFNFNEEEVIAAQAVKQGRDWDDIIPLADREKIIAEEKAKEEMEMFLPPRNRKPVKHPPATADDSGEEFDPSTRDKEDGSDESDSEKPRGRRGKKSNRDIVKGFSEQEVRRFVKSYKKFALPLTRLESLSVDAELQDKNVDELKILAESLQTQCENCIKEHEEKQKEGEIKKKGDRGPNFKFYGVSIFPKHVVGCQQELEPLYKILPLSSEERKKWTLDAKIKDVKDWDVSWSLQDDSLLLTGVYEYGLGSWEAIKMDPTYGLADKILPDGDLKPQAKQLQSRAEYLLRIIQKLNPANKAQEVIKPKKKATKAKDTSNGDAKKDKKKKEPSDEKGKASKNKDKKKKKKDQPMHYTANAEPQIADADLDPEIFALCKEKLRPVKKVLKQLDKCSELKGAEKKDLVKECLVSIGKRIQKCLDDATDEKDAKKFRNQLWTFVAKFTEYEPKKCYKMFKSAMKGAKEPKKHKSSHQDPPRPRSPENHSFRPTSEEELSNPGQKRPKSSSGASPSKRMRETPPERPPYSSYPSGSLQQPRIDKWPGQGHPGRGDERDRYRNPPYPKAGQPPPDKYRNRSYDRQAPPGAPFPPYGQPYGHGYPPQGYPAGSPYPPGPPQAHPYSGPYRDRGDWNRRPDRPEDKKIPPGHATK